MRTRNVLLSIAVGLSVASCGENPPPSTTEKPTLAVPKRYGENKFEAPVTPAAPSQVAAVPVSPVPPANAEYTIACDTFEGPAHVAEATMQKQHLIEVSHMPDWYVIHSEAKSELYYGYYGDPVNAPIEKRRQEADRARIAKLLDRLGNPLVRGTMVTRVQMADPVALPEWDLKNAPRDAYWTIEYATFVDLPDRKQMAVEMVRYYREQEHLTNVYYFHGPTVSSVCIGAWKREAMAEQGTRPDEQGRMRDDASTQSPDKALLVMSDIAPPNMPSRVTEPGTNKDMAVQALKRDVRDPDMQAAMVKFHDHLVNGRMQGQDVDGKFVAIPSFIVEIPHDQKRSANDDNWRLAGGQNVPAQQPHVQSADDAVLRSLGGH